MIALECKHRMKLMPRLHDRMSLIFWKKNESLCYNDPPFTSRVYDVITVANSNIDPSKKAI